MTTGKGSKKKKLPEVIDEFVLGAENEFTIDDILLYVHKEYKSSSRNTTKNVVKELVNHPHIFTFGNDNRFLKRSKFFHHVKFRVKPMKSEIDQGVLVTGHRLIPFSNPLTPPFECTLVDNEKAAFQKKKITILFEDAIIYYTLYGLTGMMILIHEDDEENQKLDLSTIDKQPLKLTALDFSDFYRKNSFREGDTLIFTVLDWYKSHYLVEYSSSDDLSKEFSDIRRWCNFLDDALNEVFDEYGPVMPADEQLAQAFFLGSPFLRQFHGMHIGGYLEKSNRAAITPLGAETILWRKDDDGDIFAGITSMLDEKMHTGASDDLDTIFQDIGIDMNEEVMIAYMRDELFRGEKSLKAIKERLFANRELSFYDKHQKQAFNSMVRNVWQREKRNYNRVVDQKVGKLRAEVIAINDHILAWLRSLDQRLVMPEELPGSEMMEFSRLSQSISIMLEAMNDPIELDSDIIKTFAEEINLLNEIMKHHIDSIEAYLDN